MSVGFEYVFVPGHDRATRRCGIDPGGQRVRVVVSDGRIVLTDRASSRAVAVETCDITAELNETLAVEACGPPDPAGRQAWRSRRIRGYSSVRAGAGAGINRGSRTFPILQNRNLRREVTVERKVRN